LAELSELRVRLEGALETVERATADMRAAAQEVRAGRTARLVAAMTQSESVTTQQAFETVQRLASQEPALAPIRERFIVAREAMRAATLARGAELGLPAVHPERVVAMLADAPVLFEGRAIPVLSGAKALPFVATSFVVAAGLALVHPLLVAFPIFVATVVGARVAQAPRLVVTQVHLRLGATVIAVRDIGSVLVAKVLGPNRSIVRVRLRAGETIEVDVPALPSGFVRALEQVTKVEHSS
jgi:hypothetical protein